MSDTKNAERRQKDLSDIEAEGGICEVLKRAANGEESMRPLVLELLDRSEQGKGTLMRIYGNVYRDTQIALLKPAAGKNIAIEEAVFRKIDDVRDELAGPSPTPLERILSERVALCWFDAHEMDRRFANPQSGTTFKDAEYRENRRDRTHKRFLAACKTLATVRRLAVPAIQVNVARQQVNVAGSI